MNPFFITTLGWVRDEPSLTTGDDGRPVLMVLLTIGVPPHLPGASATEWCKVIVSGDRAVLLADHVHKGQHVIVRAKSMTTEAWLTDEGKPCSAAVLLAETIALSMLAGSGPNETTGALSGRSV